MKFNYILPVLCWVLLISCHKDNLNNHGTGTASLNGADVDFKANATVQGEVVSLIFNIYDQKDVNRIQFDVAAIPFKTGTFEVFPYKKKNPDSILFTLADDLSLDDYKLLEASANIVSIDKIDQKHKNISGTFNLVFVIDTLYRGKQDVFPDTIHFSNGIFQTPFVEK